MPSSSWRLIHDGEPVGPGKAETAVALPTSGGPGNSATVFRGNGRSGTHGSNRGVMGAGPGGVAQAAGLAGNVDQAVLAEEIQRIERGPGKQQKILDELADILGEELALPNIEDKGRCAALYHAAPSDQRERP